MSRKRMRAYVTFQDMVCLTFLLAGANTMGQATHAKHVEVPVIPARTEDVSTIEGIIKASYETISGPVGAPRQWGRDRTLFSSSVRFLALNTDPKKGNVTVENSDYQEFLDRTDPYLVKEGFIEVELGRVVVKQYGNVATALSSYEGKVQSTGKVVGRGVNIFSLYKDGQRWWIQSMMWDEERPGNPIPAELLQEK
jgi:hypothetical protein